MDYTGLVEVLSDLGVVSRFHVTPIMLLAGFCLLAVAGIVTRRVATRIAHRTSTVVENGDLRDEAALIGLVAAMMVAIALIAAGLFDYR